MSECAVPPRLRRDSRITYLLAIVLALAAECFPAAGLSADVSMPPSLQSIVTFGPEDVEIEVDGYDQDYQHIGLRNADLDRARERIGQPQLPVVARWFLLPPGCTVERVEVTPLERLVIPGDFRPYPILDAENGQFEPPDAPEWPEPVYPTSTGGLLLTGQNRVYRMAKIGFFPMEYRPASGELTLLRSVRLQAVLRRLTPDEEAAELHFARPYSVDGPFGQHRRWVKETVVNPEALTLYYPKYGPSDEAEQGDVEKSQSPGGSFISEWPSMEGRGVHYVIITNDRDENRNPVPGMTQAFQVWASALLNVGIIASVKTVDAIDGNPTYAGVDRPMRIRNFIRDAAALWGTTYVLLGGDMSIVPTRRVGGPDQSGWSRPDPAADFWYSRVGSLGGPDLWALWNPDHDSWIGEGSSDIEVEHMGEIGTVFVGRLPARTAQEAAAMVKKTRRYLLFPGYEDQEASPDFYRSVTVASGPVHTLRLQADNGIYRTEHTILPEFSDVWWSKTRLYPFVGGATDLCHEGDPEETVCYQALNDYINNLLGSSADYWEGNDLRAKLESPDHVLYHFEHSDRNHLGSPSPQVYTATAMPVECDAMRADTGDCEKELKDHFGSIKGLYCNDALTLRNAPDGQDAKFFYVFSNGCDTNMSDMNSVGECFLRAPEGGAVAYVGYDTQLNEGGPPGSIEEFAEMMGDFFRGGWPVPQWTESWYHAAFSSGLNTPWEATQLMCQVPQLGDPLLWAWDTPVKLNIAVNPSTLPLATASTITVTVMQDGTQMPVEDALVCIRQGGGLYATMRTDAGGAAHIQGVCAQDADSTVYVSALLPGCIPSVVTLPVGTGSAPVYKRHVIDDCVSGGDCDSLLEVGERVGINVTIENTGSQASNLGTATLRPTPGINFWLRINGEYRPDKAYIGRASATAPTDADSFRVPLVHYGTRAEGEPAQIGTGERFRVWRVDASGTYAVSMISASACYDSVFSGVIRAEGGISNVTKIGEPSDVYTVGPDSVAFTFHGDRTEDRLTFRAEAPNWITLNQSSANLPALQPGDSATVTFNATVLEDCPDLQDLYFTVSVAQMTGQTSYSHSDLVLTFAKPVVPLLFVDREFGDFGCQDTTWRWRPVVRNEGSCHADSVVLHLRKTAGSLTILDSLVTYSNLLPGEIGEDSCFLLCGSSVADTAGFEAEIIKDVCHKSLYECVQIDPGGGCPPPAPSTVSVDLVQGTILLRWDPVPTATRYTIDWSADSPNPPIPHFLDVIGADATRYAVTEEMQAPGQGGFGYELPYSFWVRACNVGGCGNAAQVGPVWPWVTEREGWPILLPETSVCAPSVVDLGGSEGKAIFAATDRIYAFRPDGNPLKQGSQIFFDPELQERSAGKRFSEALAIGEDIYLEPGLEIAANLSRDGTYFVAIRPDGNNNCCTGELICRSEGTNDWSYGSALVYRGVESDPWFGGATLLPGARDGSVYRWTAGLNGIESQVCPGVAFAEASDGMSQQSMAISHGADFGSGPYHLLVSGTNKGSVRAYLLDAGSGVRTPVWTRDNLGTSDPPSIPAIGDVDGDGYDEVVVTTKATPSNSGSLYILDPSNAGSVIASATPSQGEFSRGNSVPPSGVALADIGFGYGYEMIVGAAQLGKYQTTIGVYVYSYSAMGGLVSRYAESAVPFNQRNDYMSLHTAGGGNGIAPIGTPLVADYDGNDKADVILTSSNGAIHAFEFDPGTNTLTTKQGWPLLLPEIAREPVLAQLDPASEQYSLVVQCADGWLHVFDLPTAETTSDWWETWPSYGYDNGNSRGCPPVITGRGRTLHPGTVGRILGGPRIEAARPVPASDGVTIDLAMGSARVAQLEILDVSGRVVRHLHADAGKDCKGHVRWDGSTDDGRRLPCGVYWCICRTGEQDQPRRLVVLR